MEERWDYVVVGGGSSGSVVAGRLAASGATVLVLEAGGTDRRPDVSIPAGIASVYRTNNYRYQPEPDASRGGVVEPWPAGRILGGGGSINATVFVRGHAADFDSWADQGATGWEYESVLPYFKRLETWEKGADDFRGGDGPISVGEHTMQHPSNEYFIAAAAEAGHTLNEDYNGKDQFGVGPIQVNQRRGVRSQASREYLRRRDGGPRPTVRTHAVVERILFDGERATGVRYRHRKRVLEVRARREVVVSTGTIASPKLLMLSGIGPAEELRRHGIGVRVDNPGVGAKLREHPTVMQRWNATIPTMNTMGPLGATRGAAQYLTQRRGILAATVMHVQVMHAVRPEDAAPAAQICFANFAILKEVNARGIMEIKPARSDGFLVATTLVHPRITGRVTLRSARPDDPPVIEHLLLGDDDDVADLLASMAEGRHIMEQSAIAPSVRGMFEHEQQAARDGDWEQYARSWATYGAHPIGTCRMGQDDSAVVDPDLRVLGVEGLRVMDASVMPSHPSGNTNAASMMIGEKGADLVINGR